MMEKLTPDQEMTLEEYKQKWLDIGLCTDRLDPEKVKTAVHGLYRMVGNPPPVDIHIVDNPLAAMDLAKKIAKERNIENFTVSSKEFYMGQHNAADIGFYDYSMNVLGIKLPKAAEMIEGAMHLSWCLFYDDTAICVQRPTEIHFDENKRLHNDKGPAIGYGNDERFAIYMLHGVRVPKSEVIKPT